MTSYSWQGMMSESSSRRTTYDGVRHLVMLRLLPTHVMV
jgi:hypothetical protein